MEEFRGIDRDVEGSAKQWRKWVESECPEKEKLPQEWKKKSLIQKLIILRAMRPDRMTYALRWGSQHLRKCTLTGRKQSSGAGRICWRHFQSILMRRDSAEMLILCSLLLLNFAQHDSGHPSWKAWFWNLQGRREENGNILGREVGVSRVQRPGKCVIQVFISIDFILWWHFGSKDFACQIKMNSFQRDTQSPITLQPALFKSRKPCLHLGPSILFLWRFGFRVVICYFVHTRCVLIWIHRPEFTTAFPAPLSLVVFTRLVFSPPLCLVQPVFPVRPPLRSPPLQVNSAQCYLLSAKSGAAGT